MPVAAAAPPSKPVFPFAMPAVKIGESVLWYLDGETSLTPSHAVVLGVHDNCADLLVYGTSGNLSLIHI